MWRAIWSSSWEGKARTLFGFAGAGISGSRPRKTRFSQMRLRMGALCWPMPPVKTRRSRPPMSAA